MLSGLRHILRRLSVRNRLILAILSASLTVVLAVALTLILLSARTIEQQAEAGLKTTIGVLKQDFVKVLLMDSPDVAADTVAKLQSFPDVLAAFLYDKNGRFQFGYQKEGTASVAVPAYQVTQSRYHDSYLEVFTPLIYNEREFGVIYMRVSLQEFKRRMQAYYKVIFVLIPALLAFAFAVSIYFQRSFSGPIQKLARAFDQVSEARQYSLRLKTAEQNEIGQLFSGFNRMLEEIELANTDLDQARQRLHVTLESISDGVVACDDSGAVIYLNRSAERMLRQTREEAQGRAVSEMAPIIRESGAQQKVEPCEKALKESREIATEPNVLLISRSGEKIPVSVSASPMWNAEGRVIGAVMVIRDITESHRLERELSYQATHDNLTGLINRSEFEQILERELNNAYALDEQFVLLYLDLDQFKVVNDTCGHLAGDQLLKQIAAILGSGLRSSDILARLGGDEFGVLLTGCDVTKARTIAESLRRVVADFRFVWEKHSFAVGVSIGMVAFDKESDSRDLLSAADVACYAAKDAGRNRIQLFQPDDAETRRRFSEVHWVSRIISGLDENRFRLYRQNILPADPGQHVGDHFEVLIRMCDDDGQVIPPGSFFPAAERFGVTPNIDRWVFRNTLAYLDSHPTEMERLQLCSINVSGHTLADEHFLDFVEAQLARSVVPAHKLCFEITETAAIADLATAKQFIGRLKERGCRFALDDFGSGLSSFGYLKNLDVDFLKIDGMFVRDMVEDPIDRSMVKSINEIGHVMGMKTIAEFVESDAIREQLRLIGVDFVQGYGVHTPEPLPVGESAPVSRIA